MTTVGGHRTRPRSRAAARALRSACSPADRRYRAGSTAGYERDLHVLGITESEPPRTGCCSSGLPTPEPTAVRRAEADDRGFPGANSGFRESTRTPLEDRGRAEGQADRAGRISPRRSSAHPLTMRTRSRERGSHGCLPSFIPPPTFHPGRSRAYSGRTRPDRSL